MRRLLVLLPTLCALSLSLAGGAEAAKDKGGGKISVCSAYGNGCVAARVRQGRMGQEVQLESGTWIDCRGDCAEALRQDVLDFWETQNEKAQVLR